MTFVLIVFSIVVVGFGLFLYLGYLEVKNPRPPKMIIQTPITDKLFYCWIGVFITFVIFSSSLGGDAISGHAGNGHYFVKSRGNTTEVSRAIWNANLVHCYLTIGGLFGLILVKKIETRNRLRNKNKSD